MTEKILVYSPGSLGDTLMICPALNFIKKQHPDHKISMLSDLPEGRSKLKPSEILEDTALIDDFVEYRKPRANQPFTALFSILKLFFSLFGKFEAVYYLVECWEGESRIRRDSCFFRLCGIRELRYFDRLQPKPRVDSMSISRAFEALYRVGDDSALNSISEDLSYSYEIEPPKSRFLHSTPSSEYVLAPFSNMPSKNWPEERYLLIARWLRDQFSLTPVIFGSSDDIDSADNLISQIGGGKSFCGRLHFRETKQKIKGCAFYFGNDSGLMHLSAAVGLPCFSIFSARDFRARWFPLGPLHVNLRRYDVECEGCRTSVCQGPVYNSCLNSIGVKFCQQQLELFIGQISRDRK